MKILKTRFIVDSVLYIPRDGCRVNGINGQLFDMFVIDQVTNYYSGSMFVSCPVTRQKAVDLSNSSYISC